MNAATFFVAVLALGFMVAIPWAIYRDRLDWSEFHMAHGPDSGCAECEGK